MTRRPPPPPRSTALFFVVVLPRPLVRNRERGSLRVEVEADRLVQVLVGVVGQDPRRKRAGLLMVVN